MEKLSITLTEKMVRHMQTQVLDGQYASTSEYIRDALRDRIALDDEIAVMKARLGKAKDALANGKALSHDKVFDQVKKSIKMVADKA